MNDYFSAEVRRVLKETRKKAGLSQEALGKKVNLRQARISHWERGKAGLTLKRFGALLAAMGYRAVITIESMEERKP